MNPIQGNLVRKETVMRIEIPMVAGLVDVPSFFPELLIANIRVDQPVRMFLKSEGSGFALDETLICDLDAGSEETNFSEILGDRESLSVVQVCGILSYLGSKEGLSLLKIPEGWEEMNLLIGWIDIEKGRRFVLYVEHELEEGKEEELHIHIALPKKKEDREVLVLRLI